MYTALPDRYSTLDVLGYRSAPYSRLDANNSYLNSYRGAMGGYRDTGYLGKKL